MDKFHLLASGGMSGLGPEDVQRLARLARLGLTPAESAVLAVDLDAIVSSFSSLAAFAETLPAAPERAPAPLREDIERLAPSEVVEAIVRAAPRVDASTGAVRAKGAL